MTGQSRVGSFIESLANVVIGIGVAVIINATVLPYFGYTPTIGENLAISGIFTGVSIVRSYIMRRAFEWFR